jgi:hypothetical protein
MRVLVLGAGSSAPAGLPQAGGIAELVPDFLEGEAREAWEALTTAGIFELARDFELGLTKLDLRLIGARRSGQELTSELVEPTQVSLWEFRQVLLPRGLSDLFLAKVDEAARNPSTLDYLKRFLRRHVEPGDRIITFNYDCLVEKILCESGLWKLRDGYGVDISDTYPELRREPASATLVLKLHGSASWFSSFDVARRYIRLAALTQLGYPPLSGSSTTPIPVFHGAVLPSYIKAFVQYPLPQVWLQAAKALRQAEAVASVGYSFPNADSTARSLFITNLSASQRLRIFYHRATGSEWAAELAALFGVGGATTDTRQASIQELAELPSLFHGSS